MRIENILYRENISIDTESVEIINFMISTIQRYVFPLPELQPTEMVKEKRRREEERDQ
jgi:hypothetical protein